MTEIVRRVAEVTADQLKAYLQSKQWFQDGNIRSVATIWHQNAQNEAEVVLPFPYVKDYRQRLREALSAVASFEKRDILQVINDVARLFADVISVRVIHADTKDGTIPISDGVLLISKAKDLLLSAAMSIGSKKKQFIGSSSKDARSYVDTLLLGQTEIGSYVVNVIAPLLGNPAATDRFGDSTPLAQTVTLNLITGLEALATASDEFEVQQSLRVFDNAVQKGASANMCDALLGFSGAGRNRSFEIKVTADAGPMFSGEPKIFSFDSSHIEKLAKASAYYKDDYVLEDRQLTGFVKKLSRPQGDNSGTITIQCTVDDVERFVQIELESEDYHNAILAHDRKSFVQCIGNVHIKSRRARLLNPQGFKVVDIKDLF